MAAEAGDGIERRPGRRQGMGLPVVDHLQAMLDMAQIAICRDHRLAQSPALTRPRRHQRADRFAGRGIAQFGMAAAPDQLLGLGEEFDLANAAAAELDVVAADRDLAMALHRVDLALDRMNVLDGGEVEVPAPDERASDASGIPRRTRGSPATARALIIAARSQFWPMPS